MVKKCVIDAILTVHENTHEILKDYAQVDLDGPDVAKKYQGHM